MINYVAENGEFFTDRSSYMKHQHSINMKKLEIINRTSWFEAGIHWIILGVFIAGYLFGWFCNYSSVG